MVAALTRAIRAAAAHVAADPDDAAAVFSPYTPKVPVEQLAAMLRSHTHNHTPVGAALRREVVKIASDLKRAAIIKPTTDPVKLANRVVVDVLTEAASGRRAGAGRAASRQKHEKRNTDRMKISDIVGSAPWPYAPADPVSGSTSARAARRACC